MPQGDSPDILWEMSEDKVVPGFSNTLKLINSFLDVKTWIKYQAKAYHEYLESDNEHFHDLRSSMNLEMIEAIAKFNAKATSIVLYYWYDIDRNKYPGHIWNTCPLSGEPLKNLGHHYHWKNRLISPNHPLTFPDVVYE
jgi:hypothetical protein